ncbi:MAG: polar amino acid transport system substrate-binding protein [Colwellia sp.]|jgi:polar amino acid transport system substrate-binding protein
MTILFRRTLLICLVFMNECFAANDDKQTKIKQGHPDIQVLSEIYPPYQMLNEEGELQGWAADKVKAIFQQSSVEYKVKIYPWARAYQTALTEPNVFIFSLLRTDEREQLFRWIAPLCMIKFSFYRLKNRPDIQVNSLAEAKNYLIAAQKGQASAEYLLRLGFEPEKHLSISYNNDNFIKMLAFGRVDLIVLSSTHFQSLINTKSPYTEIIEPIFPINYLTRNLYLASSINSSPEIIKRLHNAYDELAPQFDNECNE